MATTTTPKPAAVKATTPKASASKLTASASKPARAPRVRSSAVKPAAGGKAVAVKADTSKPVAVAKPRPVKPAAAPKPVKPPRVTLRVRVATATRKVTLQTGARFGAVLVTATTMAILYYGLFGLAREVGYATWQSALFAFPIDGLVLVAYLAAYALSSRAGRTYAWGIVLGAAMASALGQYLHTDSLVGEALPWGPAGSTVPTWAPFIAVMPAMASPLALHLSIMLSRDSGKRETSRESFRLGRRRASKLEAQIAALRTAIVRIESVPMPTLPNLPDFSKMDRDIVMLAESLNEANAKVRELTERPVPAVRAPREVSAASSTRGLSTRGAIPDEARVIVEKLASKSITTAEAARWAIENEHTTSDDILNARKLVTRWVKRYELENASNASETADSASND